MTPLLPLMGVVLLSMSMVRCVLCIMILLNGALVMSTPDLLLTMYSGNFPVLVLLMVLTMLICEAGLTKDVTGLFMVTAARLVKPATTPSPVRGEGSRKGAKKRPKENKKFDYTGWALQSPESV